MINLKKFFKPNPYLLTVSKAEKELLECFLDNKPAFDQWLPLNENRRIRFQFYYPTAVDFYFDNFKLFTAYFKKGPVDGPDLHELKMSEANYSSICTTNWQPFEEVILDFLNTLEESNKVILFRKTKSLHEYAALCNEAAPIEKAQQGKLANTSISLGQPRLYQAHEH